MLNRLSICTMLLIMGLWRDGFAGQSAPDPWQMNMHRGVTSISRDMYDLHMVAMLICAIIGLIVFGIMLYSLIHHRHSKGYKPATFHHNVRLEIVWTIIPFLILIGLAIPATRVLIRMDDTADSDVTVKIVGQQWKWQYHYLDQGIRYYSNLSTPYAQIENKEPKGAFYLLEVDKPLVLPIHKKIRFLVTSNDVIHSWWVPDLGVKRDAIPGFMHESWARIDKEGVYRGQCAELCGINHGFMPIVVEAVTPEAFNKWVSMQPKLDGPNALTDEPLPAPANKTREELMSLGLEKYTQQCAACHALDGTGLPPLYPALKNSSIAVGHPIARHIALILNGVPGSAMQPYKEQLTDTEIAAIVTYERNAWGNNTNDIVQPSAVARVRQAAVHAPTVVKKAKVGGLQ